MIIEHNAIQLNQVMLNFVLLFSTYLLKYPKGLCLNTPAIYSLRHKMYSFLHPQKKIKRQLSASRISFQKKRKLLVLVKRSVEQYDSNSSKIHSILFLIHF
jgi:hypothetical protein